MSSEAVGTSIAQQILVALAHKIFANQLIVMCNVAVRQSIYACRIRQIAHVSYQHLGSMFRVSKAIGYGHSLLHNLVGKCNKMALSSHTSQHVSLADHRWIGCKGKLPTDFGPQCS